MITDSEEPSLSPLLFPPIQHAQEVIQSCNFDIVEAIQKAARHGADAAHDGDGGGAPS